MTAKSSNSDNKFAQIEYNVKKIKDNIAEAAHKSGRLPDEIRLMAVTKTVEADYINCAISCGIDLIGENRVQEFLAKRDYIEDVEVHLIGHLQSNKVKDIVGKTDMIESVDSLKIAEKISNYSLKLGIKTDILLEVNIGREESKSGFLVEEIPAKIEEISCLEGVNVRGLMTIPPISENINQKLAFFSNIYKLFIDIKTKKIDNIHMDILSMGMSDDYETAIMAGSTLIRVGSAIFGSRQ